MTPQTPSRPRAIIKGLLDNWFYVLVLVLLIVLPFLVGWLTGSSPYGTMRGERVIMRGRSAFWMSVLIEVFALSVLVMSYNIMFGFTGVVSFGHALFFGLGGYTVGMLWQFTDLDPTIALIIGTLLTLVLCGIVGLGIGLSRCGCAGCTLRFSRSASQRWCSSLSRAGRSHAVRTASR